MIIGAAWTTFTTTRLNDLSDTLVVPRGAHASLDMIFGIYLTDVA